MCETVEVSDRDFDRIEKAIKAGTQVDEVFPRSIALKSSIIGEGPILSKREGATVRYVSGDDPDAAGAILGVDFLKKYHLSTDLFFKALQADSCHRIYSIGGFDGSPKSTLPLFSIRVRRASTQQRTPHVIG